VTTPQGRVAYATIGRGPLLLCDTGWVSHLEASWELPAYRRFFESLAADHLVVRYDKPGTGLSDRGRRELTWEPEIAAVEAIAQALRVDRLSLLGMSQGVVVAMYYAARNPDKVRSIALYGGYSRGAELASDELKSSLRALVQAHWGLGSRTLADIFLADADSDSQQWFATLQREAATPELAADLLALNYRTDLTEAAKQVRARTLVLHRRHDRGVPFRLGRELASLIPEAAFIQLEGRTHVAYLGDVEPILDALTGFFRIEGERSPGRARSVLSARETQVARLVADGRTNAEIARLMSVALRTIDSHVEHIRNKLGFRSRVQIGAWMARQEIYETSDTFRGP
jgi:pimeloyl-ACP methyl ester carboxylesterase/DNA-binding CsgD family transcriptional regulator